LVWAHLRRHVVSTLIPLGGPAGLATFVRDLGTHNVGANTAVYASILASMVNEIAFGLVLFPVLAWLALAGRATAPMVAAAAVLAAVVAGGLGGLAVLLRRGALPRAFGDRVPRRALAFLAEVRDHGIRPRDLLRPLPFALGVNACGAVMLTASLWAVGQRPTPTTILAARTIASLAALLLPFLHGAGAVEVTLVGSLHAGGVPVPDAVAATVLFRLAQFWLPLVLGALALLSAAERVRVPGPRAVPETRQKASSR
jgi:phosphatidylglycerol lysyltransferase